MAVVRPMMVRPLHTTITSHQQFVCCMRVLHSSQCLLRAGCILHGWSWPAMTEATDGAEPRGTACRHGMQLASRILHISGNSSNARQKRRNARQKNRGPDDLLHCSPCFTVVIIYIFANEYVHQERSIRVHRTSSRKSLLFPRRWKRIQQ